MLTDNLLLKFHGFHPSDFTRSYLSDKIVAIQEEAPYGSTLQATFSRQDHLFKGQIIIHSSRGKFFASASANKLKDVTHKLIDQLRKQLARWKSKRFDHSGVKKSDFADISTHKEAENEYRHMA